MGYRGLQRRRAFAALVAAACSTALALLVIGTNASAASEEATLTRRVRR